MYQKVPSARRRPAEPRSFMSWSERAANHAASFGALADQTPRGETSTRSSVAAADQQLSS